MKSLFLMIARQDLGAIESEIVILKIVLVICLMVLLGLIGAMVFMYRRNRTLKNKMKLNNHIRQAEHEAESSS